MSQEARPIRPSRHDAPPRLRTWAAEPLERRLMLAAFDFAGAATYASGRSPISVAVADFTGDGRGDVVVGHAELDGMTLLAANADGTLGEPVRLPGPNLVQGLVAGDFDGDGKQDVAGVGTEVQLGFNNDAVTVLLGNGDGTFRPPLATDLGAGPTLSPGTLSVVSGDLTDDGRPDLVVVNSGAGTATPLLGLGDGTFAIQPAISTGLGPGIPVIADFDGDTIRDLAVPLNTSFAVIPSRGDGTFGPAPLSTAVILRGGFSVSQPAAAAADVNGDGRTDLVLPGAVPAAQPRAMTLLLGNGDGTFAAPVGFGNPLDMPVSAALADFDGDGRLDVAAAGSGSTVQLYPNLGGSFGDSAGAFAVGSAPGPAAVGDVNGDGKPDVITPNYDADTISVLLNTSTGPASTTPPPTTPPPTTPPPEPPTGIPPTPMLSVGLSGDLPASALAGGRAAVKLAVHVENATGAAVSGPVDVRLFLSADDTVDAADAEVASSSKRLKLKAGAAKTIKLAIRQFPSVAAGDYRALVRITAPDGTQSVVPGATTVSVAPANIDLAGSQLSAATRAGRGGRLTLGGSILLANNGNTPAKGSVALALFASADGAYDATDLPLGTAKVRVGLAAGARKPAKFKLTSGVGLPSGGYTLIAVIDATGQLAESNETNNTVIGPTISV